MYTKKKKHVPGKEEFDVSGLLSRTLEVEKAGDELRDRLRTSTSQTWFRYELKGLMLVWGKGD